jgi:dephospho-CoA kinase
MKIAIVGKMRSGKNTLADYFISKGFKEFSFRSGIDEVISLFFPAAFEEGKPRKHYQVIGQAFRELDPDIWVNRLNTKLWVHEDLFGGGDVVVTDLRQPNEYFYLNRNDFIVIKVEAAEELRLERIRAAGDQFDPEALTHETELELDHLPFDYLVTNNGTLQDLYDQAEFILKELEGEGA